MLAAHVGVSLLVVVQTAGGSLLRGPIDTLDTAQACLRRPSPPDCALTPWTDDARRPIFRCWALTVWLSLLGLVVPVLDKGIEWDIFWHTRCSWLIPDKR